MESAAGSSLSSLSQKFHPPKTYAFISTGRTATSLSCCTYEHMIVLRWWLGRTKRPTNARQPTYKRMSPGNGLTYSATGWKQHSQKRCVHGHGWWVHRCFEQGAIYCLHQMGGWNVYRSWGCDRSEACGNDRCKLLGWCHLKMCCYEWTWSSQTAVDSAMMEHPTWLVASVELLLNCSQRNCVLCWLTAMVTHWTWQLEMQWNNQKYDRILIKVEQPAGDEGSNAGIRSILSHMLYCVRWCNREHPGELQHTATAVRWPSRNEAGCWCQGQSH